MNPNQLKPLAEWDLPYVFSILTGEFDWLDFKQSAWLGFDSGNLEKLSHYLSAWANYEGGYLVIGVGDPTDCSPLKQDDGVDFTEKTGLKEWLEDNLSHLTDPPLDKLEVATIPLHENQSRGIVVIHVPPSDAAPHQAKDGRFYTRIGGTFHPLSQRSILDILARRSSPS